VKGEKSFPERFRREEEQQARRSGRGFQEKKAEP
jgi:hypothetical protein